jgi:hypothetical protein
MNGPVSYMNYINYSSSGLFRDVLLEIRIKK